MQIEDSLPAFAQRETVFGSTPRSLATSEGLSSLRAPFSIIHYPLYKRQLREVLTQTSAEGFGVLLVREASLAEFVYLSKVYQMLQRLLAFDAQLGFLLIDL